MFASMHLPPQSKHGTFPLPPKIPSCLVVGILPYPNKMGVTIDLFSVATAFLFKMLHKINWGGGDIKGTIQYIFFGVWRLSLTMFSGFIACCNHVFEIQCVSIVCWFLFSSCLLLYGYTTICFTIHLLVDIWVVESFRLMRTKMLWTFMYKYLCGHIFSFLLCVSLGVELMGHMAWVNLT